MKKAVKITLTLLAAGLCIGCCIRAGGTGGHDRAAQVYTVKPGDTLWSIAQEYKEPDTDTRKYIQKLYRLNPGLTADIMPGDMVKVMIWEE